MSKESLEWLNANTLIGFTEKRGTAWHYRASMQGEEPNHYLGPIPVDDVKRRLFGWEALSSPVYVEDPRGGLAQVPGRQAIVRSDNGHVMGIFSDGYEPHPYVEWLINTVSRLLDAELSIGSAGLLKGGAVAWVSVEVPENVVTPEGVEFRPHLFGATSFDGSLATTFKRAVTHIVCDNCENHGVPPRIRSDPCDNWPWCPDSDLSTWSEVVLAVLRPTGRVPIGALAEAGTVTVLTAPIGPVLPPPV